MSQAEIRSPEYLVRLARETRAALLFLVDDLSDDELWGPPLPTVNPPIWEVGHAAWFYEYWVLRHWGGRASLLEHSDEFYSSSDVLHQDRWMLALPNRERTLAYLGDVLSAVEEVLMSHSFHERPREATYFALLSTYHECMHSEALAYTRQTHGYRAPSFDAAATGDPGAVTASAGFPGDAEVPGDTFWLGSSREAPFVFDNEKWSHPVPVRDFWLSKSLVTEGAFFEFVDAGGYDREEFWSPDGWAYRQRAGRDGPIYCREENGEWHRRVFDEWRPIRVDHPMVHVSWYEADAYCRWAGRRLPSEVEWEMAACAPPGGNAPEAMNEFPWGAEPPAPDRAALDFASGGVVPVNTLSDGDSAFGCRQMIGNVWEWTSSDFMPYPGFTPDPYQDYSYPWFIDHKVARGGSWATRACLIRNKYRNFYKPERNDIFVGFRTCAKGSNQ